jgi:hypothetical protein
MNKPMLSIILSACVLVAFTAAVHAAGKRSCCRDCSKARLQAGPGSFPSVRVFNARETDEMFLESASCFGANALLFSTDRDLSVIPHSFEN